MLRGSRVRSAVPVALALAVAACGVPSEYAVAPPSVDRAYVSDSAPAAPGTTTTRPPQPTGFTVPAPAAPVVAVDDIVTVGAGASLQLDPLGNDSGDGISVVAVGTAHGGTVMLLDGLVVYTPDPGTLRDHFTYTIIDRHGQTANALVVLGVLSPTANPDEVTTDFETAIDIDVLANDLAGDSSGPISLTGIASDPGHGTADVLAGGVVRYTPEAGFSGVDRFSYLITAPSSFEKEPDATALGEVVVTVLGPVTTTSSTTTTVPVTTTSSTTTTVPVTTTSSTTTTVPVTTTTTTTPTTTTTTVAVTGDPPVAVDDCFIIVGPTATGNVLPNDYDPNGYAFGYFSNTAPTAGSLTMSPDGSFTLTGHPGGATWVTFTYTIINVFGLTSTATVWIGNGDAGLTCKP